MFRRLEHLSFAVLTLLCGLVPLAALAATLYLHVPALLSAAVALGLLMPLARALLTAAHHPRG